MKNLWLFCFGLLLVNCQNPTTSNQNAEQLIIDTLKKETQYFCERKLEKWQEQWSHKPFVSKMYTGKKAFEEFIGWEMINQFTVDHIQNNPAIIPIPESDPNYTIEVFEETALVFYSKNVEKEVVREIRFMVKEGEKWKIARMETIF